MKKKILIIALLTLFVIILVEPLGGKSQIIQASNGRIFETYSTYSTGNSSNIIVDRGSGVCYLVIENMYGKAVTVMLDRDGTPMTKEKMTNNMNRINGKE